MERRQKNDLFEIGSVLEIAETNWWDRSWVFIILLHPLLCMFEIFHCNTFKNSLFSVKAESSPATQFEIINSSVLSLLYGPTLIPIRDYWKNHSFDYMDLCQQSDNLLNEALQMWEQTGVRHPNGVRCCCKQKMLLASLALLLLLLSRFSHVRLCGNP